MMPEPRNTGAKGDMARRIDAGLARKTVALLRARVGGWGSGRQGQLVTAHGAAMAKLSLLSKAA